MILESAGLNPTFPSASWLRAFYKPQGQDVYSGIKQSS